MRDEWIKRDYKIYSIDIEKAKTKVIYYTWYRLPEVTFDIHVNAKKTNPKFYDFHHNLPQRLFWLQLRDEFHATHFLC